VAITVLERVAERGAYASRALDAELARAGLDARDAGLATEIVYGALRVLPALDARIAAFLRRDARTLDGVARAALRAGCYQIDHLDRVPVHAVVDESVDVVRAARGRELAGFVNAVLRKLASGAEAARAGASRALLVPAWVHAALGDALGEARRAALLSPTSATPPLALRVRAGVAREDLAERLRAARPSAEIELGRVSPACLLAHRAGDPRALPGYAEGEFAVQEEGAQAIALACGVQEGEAVADLCAGHGGKTALLAEAAGARGDVVAIDLDARKLERIAPELARLGLGARKVDTQAIDLGVGTGGLPARFDRVLVDAPCTGLGTIQRRPELLLRVGPSDPARLADLQLAIVRNAARLVRAGGALVYAVCSPTLAEGPELARRVESELPQLERLNDAALGIATDADGVLRIGPWLSGLDANSPDVYQVVRWRVRASVT
jgi:16S rRNA (cytosine967-C5)-methyltransferase